VGFRQPADIERFANQLADHLADLVAEFDDPASTRRFRVIAGGHPAVSVSQDRTEKNG
jgi:hypothetical protein